MKLQFVLVVMIALIGGSLFAQGMSEEYVRQRADEKYSKPHGFSLEWDLFAYVPYFEQQQRVRAFGLESDRVSFTDDANGPPIWVTGGTEVRFRFSWHDSIHLGYSPYIMRAFDDDLDEPKRWNGIAFPENTDIDYLADFHDAHIHYRRDLFRLGLARNIAFYVKAGLEYAYIRTEISSDTFRLDRDRTVEEFREVLPWYNVGLGMEIEVGQSIRLNIEARGTYQVGVPTFQERDGEDMKQSVVSLTGLVGFEWKLTDWFAVIGRVHFRYLRLELYGGFRKDQFLWYSLGPDVGIGFRF